MAYQFLGFWAWRCQYSSVGVEVGGFDEVNKRWEISGGGEPIRLHPEIGQQERPHALLPAFSPALIDLHIHTSVTRWLHLNHNRIRWAKEDLSSSSGELNLRSRVIA